MGGADFDRARRAKDAKAGVARRAGDADPDRARRASEADADLARRGREASDADADLARRAFRAMSDVVLDHDRKAAVSDALGLSFARVRALRRLAAQPLTLRALAELLAADPPYVTLIVDDLAKRGLVERTPHPEDRRSKLVALTDAGRSAAARADEILGEPPAALRDAPAEDLAALVRLLERLAR